MDNILSNVNLPKDIRKFNLEKLAILSKELRDFILDIVAIKEGHLGASLGVVELTIALHYIFDTPYDNLIWDVGHQAYVHKILTDRRNKFHTNRQLGGISGFPSIKESKYDTFGTGHSSTSISAALGMALVSQLKGETDKWHIAVIGDASIASGMAFEALNHAGVSKVNLLIVLNDNSMGIDPNVGALKNHFTQLKKNSNTPQNIFRALDISYKGVIDGHNLKELIDILKNIKSRKGVHLLHVSTTKGKGYSNAEKYQTKWHAPGKFNKDTGEPIASINQGVLPIKYQDVFGYTIVDLAKKNKKIIGITPAMPTGCSLKYMMKEYPDRALDVGISEQHAVTLSAGIAKQGFIPFCNVYSTFLQRAYDQVIHDVALQNLPVIFCLDRAGIVGEDGATHHGVFDISYLTAIPNMIVFEPVNEHQLRNMMYTAQLGLKKPLSIRYPRGRGTMINWKNTYEKIQIGTSRMIKRGSENLSFLVWEV